MELNGPIDFRPKQLRKNITCGLAYIHVRSFSEEEIQLLQVYHFGDWPDVSRLKKEAELAVEVANELLKGSIIIGFGRTVITLRKYKGILNGW